MTNISLISGLSADSRVAFDHINGWFDTPLGAHVVATETAMLDQLLPGYFGYHIAQLSMQDKSLFDSSPIRNKVTVGFDNRGNSDLVARPDKLPFLNDTIDVVVLHHLLDYLSNPQDALKEVARVTLPSGNLVIVGFNPLSLWGLWKPIAGLRSRAPWNGSFIRPGRLMDWLNLLGFKIDRAQYAIYRPPVSKHFGPVRDYSQGFSRNLNLPIGSVYVIAAHKEVGAMTRIRPVWRSTQAFGRLSVVRSVKHDALSSIEHESGTE